MLEGLLLRFVGCAEEAEQVVAGVAHGWIVGGGCCPSAGRSGGGDDVPLDGGRPFDEEGHVADFGLTGECGLRLGPQGTDVSVDVVGSTQRAGRPGLVGHERNGTRRV